MQDRVPPQSLEMEQATLGAMMLDAEAVAIAAKALRPKDFYRDAHRMVFEAACHLGANNEPVDMLTLQDELQKRKQLEKVGGIAYLMVLMDATPAAARVAAYAAVVREKAVRRELIACADRAKTLAFTEDGQELDDLLAQAERDLLQISREVRGGESQEVKHISAFRTEFLDRLESVAENGGKIPGVRTGLSDIDYMLGAMEPGQMTVLGANSSTGKTAMAMNMADYAASDGKRVVIFSLEMTGIQIYRRLMASSGHIQMTKLRTGIMDAEDWSRVGRQAEILSAKPIYVCESGSETVASMAAKLRAIHAEKPVDLFVVDYLQLMPTEKQTPQEVGKNAKGLKAIAKEMGTHCLCLSQLSRAAGTGKPAMMHLRESGEIEHTADAILLLWSNGPSEADENVVSVGVNCAKARDGATGETEVWFDKRCTRFFDKDRGRN